MMFKEYTVGSIQEILLSLGHALSIEVTIWGRDSFHISLKLLHFPLYFPSVVYAFCWRERW